MKKLFFYGVIVLTIVSCAVYNEKSHSTAGGIISGSVPGKNPK